MVDTSRLALGTVQFGLEYGINNFEGKPNQVEIGNILNLAYKNNINVLDTANIYGTAEEVLGFYDISSFEIITKFLPESQNGLFEKQFEDSLKKLKVKAVYGLLAHRPMDVVENPEIWHKMNVQKSNFKVKKIGFSFDTLDQYFAVFKKSFIPDIVQVPFNYFDDRFINIIEELKGNGCEIHVRSAFLQGLFFTKMNKLSSFFDEVKELIGNLQEEYDNLLAAGLLRFVLGNLSVDKVVFGVQKEIELKNILEMLDIAPALPRFEKKINQSILMPSNWPVNDR